MGGARRVFSGIQGARRGQVRDGRLVMWHTDDRLWVEGGAEWGARRVLIGLQDLRCEEGERGVSYSEYELWGLKALRKDRGWGARRV